MLSPNCCTTKWGTKLSGNRPNVQINRQTLLFSLGYIFAYMEHALAEQHFRTFEEVRDKIVFIVLFHYHILGTSEIGRFLHQNKKIA